jgi:hypothetical protein
MDSVSKPPASGAKVLIQISYHRAAVGADALAKCIVSVSSPI